MSKNWTKIAVAYDGSASGDQALARGADLADAMGSQLIVICIAPVSVAAAAPGAIAQAEDLERTCRAFQSEAERYLVNRGQTAEYRTTIGQPGQAIVDAADTAGAELIATGARDRSFFERLIFGSVSDAVTRRAECDVLVVSEENSEKHTKTEQDRG